MTDQPFVARERELAQLDDFLDRALAGHGQVVFVTGEAGAGKTALVTEFARRAQQQHDELLVALGQCDAQTGVGDPYLPFREVLGLLTGDVETQLRHGAISPENANRLQRFVHISGQALVEWGPDLIDIFVPGGALAVRVAGQLARRTGWLERLEQLTQRKLESAEDIGLQQDHIFEQYTNVLKAMATAQPLIVALDDLQWADRASIGLLFRLGRRIGESRILIVGAYRPEEVALGRQGGRHPLEKVLAEFKRYYGDVEVDLEQTKQLEGREFVDAYLDTEPNRLGEDFHAALYQRTKGHPLFTVELLRAMRERGDLIQDDERRWVEGPALDWDALPARVEGVIEERIGRLEAELRETLTVASVEGEDFIAQVVARVRQADERGLMRQLSAELDHKHRLVGAEGIRRLGAQRLSLFRFRHNLFQRFLYDSLNEVERAYLHEDVGTVLETLYGDLAAEVAVQLAYHFEAAGLEEKTRRYLYLAGEQARRQYAHDDALAYLGRALELTPEEAHAERYAILLARETVYGRQGAREAQAQDLDALGALAENLDDAAARVEVMLRQARYHDETSDYPAAITIAQQAVALAHAADLMESEAAGHLQWGRALFFNDDYPTASVQLEQALRLAQAAGLPVVEAGSLRFLGNVVSYRGNWVESRRYYEQALSICREISDRRGEGAVLNNLGSVAANTGYHAAAWAFYEHSLSIFREIGDRPSEVYPIENLGFAAVMIGDYARARAYLEQALSLAHEVGDRLIEGTARAYLGWLFHRVGDNEAALDHCRQAASIYQGTGSQYGQGIALNFLGHALVGLQRLEEAAAAYHQAWNLLQNSSEFTVWGIESRAGLAGISLSQSDLARAQARVEDILSYLKSNSLDGVYDRFQVYLTCYRVLRANRDPRAQEILTAAYNLLQEQAANIDDEEMRRSFLENVPSHRDIAREWMKQVGEE